MTFLEQITALLETVDIKDVSLATGTSIPTIKRYLAGITEPHTVMQKVFFTLVDDYLQEKPLDK
jgi:hypothetical protein